MSGKAKEPVKAKGIKKLSATILFVIMTLSMFLLAGCGDDAVVVDGIKLSKVKIDVSDVPDAGSGGEYKTIRFTGVVQNTTKKTLSFEAVYSYRRGSIFEMRTESIKQEITLSPGETKSLSYSTDKIPGGIIDTKKIYIQNVKEGSLNNN